MPTARAPTVAPDPGPRRRPYSGTVFVVLCALGALAFVAIIVFVSPRLLARTQAAAPAPAPQEIAAGRTGGEPWTVTAVERAEDEPCLDVTAGPTATRLCTEPRGPSVRAVDALAVGGDTLVYGIVDARTTDVRLALGDGTRVGVEPTYVDFGFPLGFFATTLPGDRRLATVEALDRDGERRGAARCAGDGVPACEVVGDG